MRRGGSLVVIALLAAACSGSAGPAGDSPSRPPQPVQPTRPGTAGPSDSGSRALAAEAAADLAVRLGVPESAVTVVSVAAVTWPDTSLGCPQPGMRYTQVPVDGARIVLSADGREYAYHSGGSRPPFLCPNR